MFKKKVVVERYQPRDILVISPNSVLHRVYLDDDYGTLWVCFRGAPGEYVYIPLDAVEKTAGWVVYREE